LPNLHFDHFDFYFSLSRDAHRGFSGEGATLEDLIEDLPSQLIEAFDNYSFANQEFSHISSVIDLDIDISKIENLTAKLAAMGLLGFDLLNNNYFYRRLPFKMKRILSLNPRLKNAETLIKENKIQIIKNENGEIESIVKGSGIDHYVAIKKEKARCTCLWYSKNQGERGHCKHILATKKITRNN